MTDSNIAILIDYENVGVESLQNLTEQLSGLGRIIVKRAYADWSSQRKGQEKLIELGIEAVHNYRGVRSGKNSCDIKLTIDTVELLHNTPIDTFVIVSSDSDFVPLVNHLRGSGKSVIGAGRRAVTSSTMVKSCDRYIFLKPLEVKKRNTKNNFISRNNRVSENGISSQESPDNSNSITDLLSRAIEATIDDNGNALGTKLAQTMTRIDPSFNYRDLGFSSFRDFLESRNEISVTLHEGTDFTVAMKVIAKPQAPNVKPKILSHNNRDADSNSESLPINWETQVDEAWNGREKETIAGRTAAKDAANILGFKRLSDSLFPTLDKLLDASKLLKSNWSRNKNSVEKKK
ncbi:MAG: hypothetical protein CL748_06700 [Chloroflexi bacterium]|nr:hypothetical protein [Chloroflexota bacterium]